MPTFFSSTFRKGRATKPETAAIKQANLIIEQAKANNSVGVVNNTSVYDMALKVLEPYEDEVAVATKIAGLKAERNQLTNKQNDEGLTSANLRQVFEEGQYIAGKNAYQNPGEVINKTAAMYDLYDTKLTEEIQQRIDNNQSYSSLLTIKREIAQKTQDIAALARSYQAQKLGKEDPESPSVPKTGFGFYVHTNPATGKIINFRLEPIDETSDTQRKGYIATDSFYGGVPVYANAVRDPSTQELKARIGDSEYKAEVESNEVADTPSGNLNTKVLRLQNPREITDLGFKESFKNIFRTGDTQRQFDTGKGAYEVDLKDTAFETPINYPKDSFGRDTAGNYYYLDNSGTLFQSGNVDVLANKFGKSPEDIKNSSFYLTRKDVDQLNSQQDPNRTDRVISPTDSQTPLEKVTPGAATPTSFNSGSGQNDNLPQLSPQNLGSVGNSTSIGIQKSTGKENQQKLTENIVTGNLSKKGSKNYLDNIA